MHNLVYNLSTILSEFYENIIYICIEKDQKTIYQNVNHANLLLLELCNCWMDSRLVTFDK